MKTVINKNGYDLQDFDVPPVGKEKLATVILESLVCGFIPFGGIAALLSARNCLNKRYLSCHHKNGLHNQQYWKPLNTQELKEERINAIIYISSFVLFRIVPISYYLIYHAN